MNGAYFLLIVFLIFRGLYPVVAKQASILTSPVVALAGANLVWLPIYYFAWNEIRQHNMQFPPWTIAVLLGSGGVSLAMTLSFYKVIHQLPIWLISVVADIAPILTILIAYFAFGETINLGQAMGIGLVVLGMIVITFYS